MKRFFILFLFTFNMLFAGVDDIIVVSDNANMVYKIPAIPKLAKEMDPILSRVMGPMWRIMLNGMVEGHVKSMLGTKGKVDIFTSSFYKNIGIDPTKDIAIVGNAKFIPFRSLGKIRATISKLLCGSCRLIKVRKKGLRRDMLLYRAKNGILDVAFYNRYAIAGNYITSYIKDISSKKPISLMPWYGSLIKALGGRYMFLATSNFIASAIGSATEMSNPDITSLIKNNLKAIGANIMFGKSAITINIAGAVSKATISNIKSVLPHSTGNRLVLLKDWVAFFKIPLDGYSLFNTIMRYLPASYKDDINKKVSILDGQTGTPLDSILKSISGNMIVSFSKDVILKKDGDMLIAIDVDDADKLLSYFEKANDLSGGTPKAKRVRYGNINYIVLDDSVYIARFTKKCFVMYINMNPAKPSKPYIIKALSSNIKGANKYLVSKQHAVFYFDIKRLGSNNLLMQPNMKAYLDKLDLRYFLVYITFDSDMLKLIYKVKLGD